jgi:pyruvate/2-oxoglutarate dehydrogenase complex dihydrolipoamide dehydrogenase (E3) component
VAPHDSVERYTGLGVEVCQGYGRLVDPWTVAIQAADGSETRLTSRAIVLATGASPVIPPIPGIETVRVLTSENLWEELRLSANPRPSMLVLGGGPIGCELSQAMAQLGLRVTLVQRNRVLLPKEDEEVSVLVRQALQADGVRVLTGAQVSRLNPARAGGESAQTSKGVIATVEGPEGTETIEADELLCAIGRRARMEGYGLDTLGIPTGRTIETNGYLQTRYPNICAVGDVAGPWQFTHTASHQAWYGAVNTLFAPLRFKVDGRVIPRTTFTDPEVATVGLTEREARQRNVAHEVTHFELAELDRAIVESAETGFVKVLTPPGKDKLLGVTIVGDHAGELLTEFVLAMKWNLGLGRIMGAIHAYPTMAEANKYAAGVWKKAHAPQRTLQWLKRYHEWRRG